MSGEAIPSMHESIKKIASNLVNSMHICDIKFGTVVGVNPLRIKIDDQEPLREESLVLTNMVRDHYVDLTVSFQTENDMFLIKEHTHPYEDTQPNGQPVTKSTQTTPDLDVTHKHEIKHKIKVLKHYALTQGEGVILIRTQGAKKYVVLDRIGVPPVEGEWL